MQLSTVFRVVLLYILLPDQKSQVYCNEGVTSTDNESTVSTEESVVSLPTGLKLYTSDPNDPNNTLELEKSNYKVKQYNNNTDEFKCYFNDGVKCTLVNFGGSTVWKKGDQNIDVPTLVSYNKKDNQITVCDDTKSANYTIKTEVNSNFNESSVLDTRGMQIFTLNDDNKTSENDNTKFELIRMCRTVTILVFKLKEHSKCVLVERRGKKIWSRDDNVTPVESNEKEYPKQVSYHVEANAVFVIFKENYLGYLYANNKWELKVIKNYKKWDEQSILEQDIEEQQNYESTKPESAEADQDSGTVAEESTPTPSTAEVSTPAATTPAEGTTSAVDDSGASSADQDTSAVAADQGSGADADATTPSATTPTVATTPGDDSATTGTSAEGTSTGGAEAEESTPTPSTGEDTTTSTTVTSAEGATPEATTPAEGSGADASGGSSSEGTTPTAGQDSTSTATTGGEASEGTTPGVTTGTVEDSGATSTSGEGTTSTEGTPSGGANDNSGTPSAD